MFGTTQRRSVTTTGRFRSGRLRNLVGIDLEEKTLQDKPFGKKCNPCLRTFCSLGLRNGQKRFGSPPWNKISIRRHRKDISHAWILPDTGLASTAQSILAAHHFTRRGLLFEAGFVFTLVPRAMLIIAAALKHGFH